MKQARKVLSTYSSDTFGVISALYGLGGLLVMHDASGCNSTFTTHDEPRWFGDDGLVFVSAVTEDEAVMGTAGDRLAADMIETANYYHPKFTAIASTPIPWMTGSDIDLTVAQIEEATGIPSFGFDVSGMKTYEAGASAALLAITERFCTGEASTRKGTVAILGATPLDIEEEQLDHIGVVLRDSGKEVICTSSINGTLEELAEAKNAEVALVVSVVGIDQAEYLYKTYGVPYVIGLPCGPVTDRAVTDALEKAIATGKPVTVFEDAVSDETSKTVIIGEVVASRSLALEKGGARVIVPTQDSKHIAALLSAGDKVIVDEAELENELKSASDVYADGLYKFIIPSGARLIKVHHRAYSGRIY